jgi:hypothetical protein
MNLAVLFWFYKDVDICRNRLKLLRKHNPALPIFGLYGGAPGETGRYEQALAPLLDDFFACFTEKDADWKWRNGDVAIAVWHRQRGQHLAWDTVVVAQWDMLVLDDVSRLVEGLRTDEVFLSGLRPIDEVIDWWPWVTRDRADYERFQESFRARYGENAPLLACQFVGACLPRRFLDAYAALDLELGFLEYRLPSHAGALGMAFGACPRLECAWPNDPQRHGGDAAPVTLTAQKVAIDFTTILRQLWAPGGARVFHPYNRLFPVDVGSAFGLARDIVATKLGL